MSRIALMTWGLLLIFFGVQLNLVNSFVLTPRATKFWKSKLSSSPFEGGGGGRLAAAGNQFGPSGQNQFAPNQFAAQGRQPILQGTSFSNQYANRTNFPYSTPNYRRVRSDGGGVFQSGFRNDPNLNNQAGPFRNAGFGNPVNGSGPIDNLAGGLNRFPGQKMITPPTWFCWPPIFLGAVMTLYGAVRR